jgi:hypothetical protein
MIPSCFIYSPEYYEAYENLENLPTQSQRQASQPSQPSTKTIVWKDISIATSSKISWNCGVAEIRESTEFSLLIMKVFRTSQKSEVPASFIFTQKNLLTEYKQLNGGVVPTGIMLVPLVSLRGFRIVGVFRIQPSIPVSSPIISNDIYSFMMKIENQCKLGGFLNIADPANFADSTKVKIYLDTGKFSDTTPFITITSRRIWECLHPYMTRLKLHIIKRIKSCNSWRTPKKLEVQELFDDYNYKDASKS